MMKRIRVLLADDSELYRCALLALFEANDEIEIVGIATHGDEVLQRVNQTQPDVICMDIQMPGLSGIAVTLQLVAAQPGVKIVGLSAHKDSDWIKQMMDAGALGYVDKLRAAEELSVAIRSVHSRQRYLCSKSALAVTQPIGA